jgi:hypothetical protein
MPSSAMRGVEHNNENKSNAPHKTNVSSFAFFATTDTFCCVKIIFAMLLLQFFDEKQWTERRATDA